MHYIHIRVERKWPLKIIFRFKFGDRGEKLHFRFKKNFKKFGYNNAIPSGAAKSFKLYKKKMKKYNI